jgi:SPX domain protein involved in polyphosphate accumulation
VGFVGLVMLHNFSVYNDTAFEKILKKHDKNMRLQARTKYLHFEKQCSFSDQSGSISVRALQVSLTLNMPAIFD